MLLTVNYSGINLNPLLIKISNEIEIKGIYKWERCINPIDNNRLKDKFHHATPAHIKKYLYDNEISYVEVSGAKIEIYRDFFGLSDIYYCRSNDQIMISETLKDFYSYGVNSEAVEQYQRIGYVPADNTIINNVKKAFPGERISFDIKANDVKHIRKPITDLVDQSLKFSHDNFQEQFETILTDNLKGADGLFLSGGFDSALLAYFLNKKGNVPVAFTGYTKDKRNQIEKKRSIKSAELFCKKHELIEFTDDDFEDIYLDVFRCMDEPFADNAILGEAVIAMYANSRGLKRLAEGEAADAFWGHAYKIKKYLLIRKVIRNDLQRNIARKIFFNTKLRKLSLPRYELIKNCSGCKCLTEKEFDDISHNLINKDYTEDYNLINILIFLSSNIGFEVPKVKLAAFSSGIKVIAPFLESKMMKMALMIPPNIKYKRDKSVIKDLYESKLLRENYEDQKTGFLVPTADWILDNHRDILCEGNLYEKSDIEKLVAAYKQNPQIELNQKIWRVFVLTQWYASNKSDLGKNRQLA